MLLASHEVDRWELDRPGVSRANASLEARVTQLEHQAALQETRMQAQLARLHAEILMDLWKGTVILLISALIVVALVQ